MKLRADHKEPSKMLVVAAFAAVYIIWGSTYVGIALAIKSVPPFLMAGLRFFAAGFILFIWCIIKGEKIPDLISVLKNSLAGILMLFCGTTALIWSEQYLPSGLAAVIVASVPFWFVILDKKHWKENFSSKFILIGLLIGFTGILLLFNGQGAINLHSKVRLVAFIVLFTGSMLWSAGSLYSKYTTTNGNTTIKASIQMMAAGVTGFIAALIAGEEHYFVWGNVTTSSINAMLYLILFGSLVGYIAYIWLLDVRPAALVGTYAYVNPAVAIFLGWLIDNEVISVMQVIALIIILSGVLLINFPKYKK